MADRRRAGNPGSAGWRDDRAWQAGLLIGSALGAAATVVGRRVERRAREGLVDWPTVERIAIARLARAPGMLTPAELAAAETAYADAMTRIVPGAGRRPRHRAAGRRRAIGCRGPGRLGPCQHDLVRVAHRQARGRAARPGRAGGGRPGQGDDGPRQPLDHDPPARVPAGVHGPARARPVRPRPPVRGGDSRAGCCSSRRTSARRPRTSASRSTRSGPGSRSTRRPTPSSSRHIRGSARTSPRGSSASCRCSAPTPGRWAATRSPAWAARSAVNQAACTGSRH